MNSELTDEQRATVERIRASCEVKVAAQRPRPEPRPLRANGRRSYRCGNCGQEGHQASTCGRAPIRNIKPRAQRERRLPRSTEAARWLMVNGGTFTSAGLQYGISREAVRQGWAAEYPGVQPPHQAELAARNARIVARAKAGELLEDIARTEELSKSTVLAACREAGHVPNGSAMLKQQDFERAVELVLTGASPTEASGACNVSLHHLYLKLRELGIDRPHIVDPKRFGASSRASERYDRGEFETIAEAARAERVSPTCVYMYRARHGLRTRGR